MIDSTRAIRTRACRTLGLALIALAAALPAAISQAATAGHQDSTSLHALKACRILTAADLHAVLGGAVNATAQNQGAFSGCMYTVSGRMLTFMIADQHTIKAQTAYTSTAGYWHATTFGNKKQTVAGLGTSAVWLPRLGQLWVLKGTTMFSVSEFPVRPTSLSVLTKLARRALTHF